MAAKTYAEKLRDPRWQRRRLEILNRTDFRCEVCASAEKTLNVHHKLYRKGAMPWEYSDRELAALCEDCHEVDHALRSRLDAAVASLSSDLVEQIVGYAEATAAMLNCGKTLSMHSEMEAFGVSAAFMPCAFVDALELADAEGVVEVSALWDLFQRRCQS